MRKLILILLAVVSLQVNAQDKKVDFKNIFKFGTVCSNTWKVEQ